MLDQFLHPIDRTLKETLLMQIPPVHPSNRRKALRRGIMESSQSLERLLPNTHRDVHYTLDTTSVHRLQNPQRVLGVQVVMEINRGKLRNERFVNGNLQHGPWLKVT